MSVSVSVVIPAFRAARTIGRAIDSVLAQTNPASEILVVDDGSPDDLAAAVAPYGDRVTFIRKPNGGAASARNLGLDRSRADLIAFLDADDFWEPQKLARQVEVLRRHSDVGLTASRYFEQPPGDERRPPKAEPGPWYDRVLAPQGEQAFDVACLIWTGTLLVRRSLLGSKRFQSGLEPAEDRDLWAQLVVAGGVYLVSEPLATAVLEPGSLSRANIDTDCANMLRVIHRRAGLLGRRGVRRWEAKTYRRWAAGHLGSGRPESALRPALYRLRRNMGSLEAWWILAKSAGLACLPRTAGTSLPQQPVARPG